MEEVSICTCEPQQSPCTCRQLNQVHVQAGVRTNDLLNAVHFVAAVAANRTSPDGTLPSSTQQEFTALVGAAYYALKQTLILDEQYLLRSINFDIVVEHPHKYLFNFAKAIGAQHSLVQLSVSLLNDSIVYSELCLSHTPADIAAACLQVAGHVLESHESMPFSRDVSDWKLLGVNIERLEVVANLLLETMLSHVKVTI